MPALCLLAMILISQLPDKQCRFNRKNSRTSRLIRFLSLACPTFFVTVTPNRDRSYCEGKIYAIKSLDCTLRPDFDKAINSLRLRILSAFVKKKRNGQASLLRWHLTRQTDPAFGSSPIDDSSARFGRHSFSKAMISGPFNSTGLKGSFHFTIPLHIRAQRLNVVIYCLSL